MEKLYGESIMCIIKLFKDMFVVFKVIKVKFLLLSCLLYSSMALLKFRQGLTL